MGTKQTVELEEFGGQGGVGGGCLALFLPALEWQFLCLLSPLVGFSFQ